MPDQTSNITAKAVINTASTLLEDKIKSLKKWIRTKEIERLLKNQEKLEKKLFLQIERTIKRASEISTIIFPQHKIKIDSIYEPITLELTSKTPIEKGKEGKIDINGHGKSYLIIDDAGMGKSTFVKHLTIEIIRNSEKVPILFELLNYNKNISLLENLAKDFDEVTDAFDRDIFLHLIVSGKFFIILDGFDEVNRDIVSKIKNEISELNEKKGKSCLILTSRPQEILPTLNNSINFKIKKLSKNQAKSILLKIDAICENEETGKKLISEFKKIPERFTETPLLVGLLYKTYSYNKSIADNIAVFYSEIFQALYKGHDLTKAGFVRNKKSNLDISKFRNLLSAFSFLYIIEKEIPENSEQHIISTIENAIKILAYENVNAVDFFDDLLVSVPLLTKEGNSFKFMHRTIAEYFSAEFICNNLDNEKLLLGLKESSIYPFIWKTIDFVYEINADLYNKVITKELAEKFITNHGNSKNGAVFTTEEFLYDSYILITSSDRPKPKSGYNRGIGRTIDINEQKFSLIISFREKEHIPKPVIKELFEKFDDSASPEDGMTSIHNLLTSRFIENKHYKLCTIENKKIFKDNAFAEIIADFIGSRLAFYDIDQSGPIIISKTKCTKLLENVKKLKNRKNEILDLIKL